MFFLLRMTFWLGLVLVLLPTDQPENAAERPQIDTMEAVAAAGAVMSDMSQFCTRQPTTCEVGSQAAIVIGQRAQAGARKVYHMITDHEPEHSGLIEAEEQLAPADTLSSRDLKIKHRRPQA